MKRAPGDFRNSDYLQGVFTRGTNGPCIHNSSKDSLRKLIKNRSPPIAALAFLGMQVSISLQDVACCLTRFVDAYGVGSHAYWGNLDCNLRMKLHTTDPHNEKSRVLGLGGNKILAP